MTLTDCPAVLPSPSRAADRFARNCRALGLDVPLPDLQFCTARDGSATAKRDGVWLAGCSVPRRAAEVMVRKSAWLGPTVCLLLPTHGQQIEAVLHRLGRPHGLIVRAASRGHLADLLACCDVADAAAEGRLFVACDDAGLRQAFDDHPGLAVPQQMVRLPDADAAEVTAVIATTRAVLADVTARHAARVAAGRSGVAPPTADWCVLAPQAFALWDDAGHALAAALGLAALDPTFPPTAAPAHAAEAIAACAVVVAADAGRADRPDVVRPDRPWVAWVTKPRVPAYVPACPHDAVLLADAAFAPLAAAAGWPASRVALAGRPAAGLSVTPAAPPALVADLPAFDPPSAVTAASTRQSVWEAIVDELTRDPFALGDDPAAYVARAPGRMRLEATDDFPARLFLDRCVGPAFLLGVARRLARAGVAFTVHGDGWSAHADLAAHVCGPVADRAAFRAVVAGSGGLIDAFPAVAGHPVRSLGVPVVRAFGRTASRLLQDIAAARTGRLTAEPVGRPLTRKTVAAMMGVVVG